MSDNRLPGTGMGTTGQPQAIPRPAGVQPGPRPPAQPGLRPATAAPTIQPARPITAAPVQRAAPPPDDPIALEEEFTELEAAPKTISTSPGNLASKIKFGPDLGHKKHEWKRKPHLSGAGAIRVKSFHAKYSDQGIEHLDDAINEWLDEHPEVEVKFATQTVHVFEGKIREPAIVMNVWY